MYGSQRCVSTCGTGKDLSVMLKTASLDAFYRFVRTWLESLRNSFQSPLLYVVRWTTFLTVLTWFGWALSQCGLSASRIPTNSRMNEIRILCSICKKLSDGVLICFSLALVNTAVSLSNVCMRYPAFLPSCCDVGASANFKRHKPKALIDLDKGNLLIIPFCERRHKRFGSHNFPSFSSVRPNCFL